MARIADFFKPAYPSKAIVMTPGRRWKLLWSYAPDWILTLALAALFFSLDKVDGYRRVFSLEDTSLRHPYALHERVPDRWLYLICAVAPLVLLLIINFFTVRSWWDWHNSWLGLILGLALTGAVTQFVKITVGRPRPDVIARCIPPEGSVDPPFGLTDWTICTQVDVTILRDGFRSFPSGHSSMSFAGLGFLSFYLAGKMHLFDKRGHAGKAWLALTPFCGAALVAISRSMDYRHHWHDILVGSLLGVVLSFFAYRQYYPSLSSEVSHKPYSPRIKDASEEGTGLASGGGGLPLHNAATSSTSRSEFASARYPLQSRGEAEYHELDGTVQRPGQGNV
ncbi:phosphatidic acid phosphatase type 2/haloperoxidase [Ephemerocybe angulata]|uniref:Phosphatidic acid phosphatase type 2/haloperoxidase n=1 Tax=Ephemerocybe angulata TaxID=980116 RepID=A0A8H6HGG2_9AGAR|nr:phosphatidic acid phosphatase type 2/haloperoxidase [Tulosesus angulatus]